MYDHIFPCTITSSSKQSSKGIGEHNLIETLKLLKPKFSKLIAYKEKKYPKPKILGLQTDILLDSLLLVSQNLRDVLNYILGDH